MLTRRLIPCLDVRDGRVVKGVRFQGLRDAGDPAELAARYEAEGADEVVILDVSATPEGRSSAADTVERVRTVLGIPLTVGGGVRTCEDASRLLAAGADKVAVNTAAVLRPDLIEELALRFGSQCTVVAIDAAVRTGGAPGWEVVVRSGSERTGIDAVEWARACMSRGAGEILLTSWDRDGTGEGYDLGLLREVCGAVGVPVIASGGADSAAHMADGVRAGAEALLAASIFHDARHTVIDVKRALASMGVPVRLEADDAEGVNA
ncbi:MAG: imidazole glycerol phosphate synthase subunit HisF [Phycisphaerales bacterium]|nr:MAG: imidazole glycerol phosphate synthase subunit HisF [Phycisphaerales bacterium]